MELTQPSPATAIKLRLMCSNGGHIIPRPHDKSLCYVGGETHIITMDRHTTLSNLTSRITKTLIRPSSSLSSPTPTSFSIKYQLPTEDLDSLISIANDEDLENMIDEYDRLDSKKRIRLFIFPTGRVGSDFENFNKSGDWSVNDLNCSNSGVSDTCSSVNCLLGLDDEKKDGNSIPGSPMRETTSSSFGSASNDQLKVVGIGIEEQFSQLMTSSAPVAVSGLPVSSATAIYENSDPFLFYRERSQQDLHMGYLNQQKQQDFQQKQSAGFDFASPDSVLSGFTITDQLSPVAPLIQVQSSNNTSDQNPRIQMQQQQQIPNPAYLLPIPTTKIETQQPQLHQQQLQYIQPLQYIPHRHPAGAVPVSSYYPQYPHQPPTNQQNFMYYIPTRQPPQGYNYPLQQLQPSLADTQPVAANPNNQTPTNSGGPQLVRVLSDRQNQNQYVGYSKIHHPSETQYSQLAKAGDFFLRKNSST